MADSQKKGSGKRERLIASAAELLHRQGVAEPTLAEIATAAEVPPGNVYYYFKTRDELVRAVVELRAEAVGELLGSLEQESDPALRLKGLARSWSAASGTVAAYGCPIGSLCSELNKVDGGPKSDAATLLGSIVDWIEKQFEALDHSAARDRAISLMARVQGAALLADTFEDPTLIEAEVGRIESWIDSLAADGPA